MGTYKGGVNGRTTAAKDQALRLLKGRPELRAKVLAGSMAPSAALIAAGRRRRYLRIPRDDVQAAMAALVKIHGRVAVQSALINFKSGVSHAGCPRSASSLVVRGRSPLAAGGGAGPSPEGAT